MQRTVTDSQTRLESKRTIRITLEEYLDRSRDADKVTPIQKFWLTVLKIHFIGGSKKSRTAVKSTTRRSVNGVIRL